MIGRTTSAPRPEVSVASDGEVLGDGDGSELAGALVSGAAVADAVGAGVGSGVGAGVGDATVGATVNSTVPRATSVSSATLVHLTA